MSYLRATQPRRSDEYYTALLATGHYIPHLQSQYAHNQRQRARASVANNPNLPLHIRQEASRDLRLHKQKHFTYTVQPLQVTSSQVTSSQPKEVYSPYWPCGCPTGDLLCTCRH